MRKKGRGGREKKGRVRSGKIDGLGCSGEEDGKVVDFSRVLFNGVKLIREELGRLAGWFITLGFC